MTASHEPASNASNATTCSECHAGLKVLPNIEQAMLSSMIQDTNRNGTPSTGKMPATRSTTAVSASIAASRLARQDLAPEAVERKGVERSQVIEVVAQELGSVRREQLATDQHARRGQPEAKNERADEDLGEHRGMGQ